MPNIFSEMARMWHFNTVVEYQLSGNSKMYCADIKQKC